MNKLLLALGGTVLLGCVLWLLSRGDERAGEPPAASPRAGAPAKDEAKAEHAAPAASAAAVSGGEAREALAPEAPPPQASAAASPPRSRVFGLVADQRGAPIEGAVVNLHGMDRWVDEEIHPGEVPSTYTVITGRDGRFSFDVLTPSSDWVMLAVTGGIYRGKVGRDFGIAGGRNEDPLRVGDNDLGTFVLPDAGGVAGRVTDSAGAPLSGATVMLEESQGSFTLSARTDERGAYELGGLPAGPSKFTASQKGYLRLARSGIDVQVGQTAQGLDFALAAAPSLAGRVVDQSGAPLAGVKLWGWPASHNGSGAGARSAEDGSFVVHLPQDEPYTLGAELPGYEELSDRGPPFHAAGTRDIVLVLKRPTLHAFHVRDAVTGRSVERFGMKLIRVRTAEGGTLGSSVHREPEPLGDHRGGVVELPGDPALCDYVIEAPGYGSQRGPVALDMDGKQVVALQPEASLTGHLLQGGHPVPDPVVCVEADLIPTVPKGPELRERGAFAVFPGQDDPFAVRQDLDEFTGRRRIERGGPDGSFRVGGLAAGTYELVVSGTGTAPLKLERLQLKSGEARDLGELEAPAPAEIAGVLLLPTDMPRGGLRVMLGEGSFPNREKAQVTDDTGTFRFAGLGAGVHQVFVEGKPGVILPGPPFPVELAGGESRRLELDLAPRVPCTVSVRARLSGPALEGVHVVARRPTEGGWRMERIGELDAQGRGQGFVAGGEVLAFELRGPSEAIIASNTPTRSLEAGGSIELEFEAELGSLIALMPAAPDAAGPPRLHASLRLAGGDWTTCWLKSRPVDAMLHLDLGALAPGEYELRVWRGGGGEAWTATANVQAGQTASVELRSP